MCNVLACRERSNSTQATATASAMPSASAAAPWKPHKLSKIDAEMFCAELVEGGIATKCAGGAPGEKTDVDVFTIPGRQRTEAHGTLVYFPPSEGSFPQWIAESIAGDAGVDPVYHYNANVKMLISFVGDVPEETKLRVVEALDAL